MLVRVTRWVLIAAPVLAGVLLLIFGTAGAISTAFGVTLIGIAPIVWMWNWFIRMSFDDRGREAEGREREDRAREQLPTQRPQPPPKLHRDAPRKLGARQRRRPQ